MELIDFSSKAKELQLSEAGLRGRILSGKGECFIHLAEVSAQGTQDNPLPPWEHSLFPLIRWADHGSYWERNGFGAYDGPRVRTPQYTLSGWVVLDQDEVAKILMRGQASLSGMLAWVVDAGLDQGFPVTVRVKPDKEWIELREHEEGGYYRDVPVHVSKEDLFFLPEQKREAEQAPLSARKERSYMGIISAMLELLLDKDGGGFPSQARIIEALEVRYGSRDGISKRNLEKVFAQAARTSDR